MSGVDADVVVIGGGILGLAVAAAVLDGAPGRSVIVLEKEPVIAAHQTGRNSGVIHSGIYYRPGSLKARTVAAGRELLVRFCDEHGVAYERCGKVVVATDDAEHERLLRLQANAAANGIDVELLGPGGLRDVEPHATGVAALRVPSTGIVDFVAVCHALAGTLPAAGGELRLGNEVLDVADDIDSVVVTTSAGEVRGRRLVNCGGLHADRIAALHTGRPPEVRIVPFRGEYYELSDARRHLVRHLIYPVPDPAFPFLGVHFTRSVHGGVHAGPNAVLALAREGYRWSDVDRSELRELAAFAGVRRLARRHWRMGLGEVHRSLSKRAFVRALQRLVPEVEEDDLERAPAGVRAQALDPQGALVDDFVLRQSERIVDVLNAPSPAATASLEIGRVVAASVFPLLQ